MTKLHQEDTEFLNRLKRHPQLRHYFEEMLETAELKNESVITPDDAEDAVLLQVRKTGQEMLRIWAQNAHDKVCENALTEEKIRTHQKKRSTGTPLSEQLQ